MSKAKQHLTGRPEQEQPALPDADAEAEARFLAKARSGGVEEPQEPPSRVDGYVWAYHPDHGEMVTYQPGELLPEWAQEAFARQRPEAVTNGQFTIYPLEPEP